MSWICECVNSILGPGFIPLTPSSLAAHFYSHSLVFLFPLSLKLSYMVGVVWAILFQGHDAINLILIEGAVQEPIWRCLLNWYVCTILYFSSHYHIIIATTASEIISYILRKLLIKEIAHWGNYRWWQWHEDN